MKASPKIGADDEVPNGQQVDTGLKNKLEEVSKLPDIQPIEQEIQLIESGSDRNIINSRLPREWRLPKNLSLDNVIGKVKKEVSTRRSLNHFCEHMAFVSQVEPKIVADALEENNWINAIHE